MERNFYNDEFEHLIREKTDQYKMYPSENVWKGIHGSLHTKRRWFIGVMSVLITGIIFFAGKELIIPGNHPVPVKKLAGNLPAVPVKTSEDNENNLSAALSEFKSPAPGTRKSAGLSGQPEERRIPQLAAVEEAGTNDPVYKIITDLPPVNVPLSAKAEDPTETGSPVETPASAITQPSIPHTIATGAPAPEQAGLNSSPSPTATKATDGGLKPVETARTPENAGKTPGNIASARTAGSPGKTIAATAAPGKTADANGKEAGSQKSEPAFVITGIRTFPVNNENGDVSEEDALSNSLLLARVGIPAASPVKAGPSQVLTETGKQALHSSTNQGPAESIPENADRKDAHLNWLEEYAMYELIPPAKKKSRRSIQLYFSPTVNFRHLSGGDNSNSKTDVQNVPIALNHQGKVDDFVNHKPALGFEAGGNLLYRATRNLTLKAGLQFNYIQYTIKAYASSNPERATIALNPSYYGYFTDSITSYTNIRNFGGRTPTTLNNRYYQLSMPVGFELRILGNERIQLNIAATIQPTYLLNRNSWLLSTDYTNYTKEPSLYRKWNLNGGVEAFLSYRIGGFRWQIGPEFRYQLLSSYTSQYPIRESLREYGLKIGVSKTIR